MAMRHRELLDTKKDRKMLNENCSFSLDFALKLSTNLLFLDKESMYQLYFIVESESSRFSFQPASIFAPRFQNFQSPLVVAFELR